MTKYLINVIVLNT